MTAIGWPWKYLKMDFVWDTRRFNPLKWNKFNWGQNDISCVGFIISLGWIRSFYVLTNKAAFAKGGLGLNWSWGENYRFIFHPVSNHSKDIITAIIFVLEPLRPCSREQQGMWRSADHNSSHCLAVVRNTRAPLTRGRPAWKTEKTSQNSREHRSNTAIGNYTFTLRFGGAENMKGCNTLLFVGLHHFEMLKEAVFVVNTSIWF